MSATIVGGEFINSQRLEQRLVKAFETWTRFDVNDYFRDQFLEDKWLYQFLEDGWPYDGETVRKNGETVTSPRNIFDLGDLYRSGRDSFRITQGGLDITATWDWDAANSSGRAYAWYVHEGLSTNRTARPWTDVFQQKDLFDASNVSKELRTRIRAALSK